jgi:hypothetical protein
MENLQIKTSVTCVNNSDNHLTLFTDDVTYSHNFIILACKYKMK